jgi:hypothetical protein
MGQRYISAVLLAICQQAREFQEFFRRWPLMSEICLNRRLAADI